MTVRRLILRCSLLLAVFGNVASVQSYSQPHAKKPPSMPTVALPRIGDEVPPTLLKRSSGAKTCDTGDDRHEPCAVLTLQHDRITIAWDDATKRVTYLYSSTLVTDQDVRVGDLLPISSDLPVTPFPLSSVPHRFVSADWCDTVSDLSNGDLWCAVMVPARPRSGKVLGFVQSIYLALPNPDAPLLHRTVQMLRRGRPKPRSSSKLIPL